MTAGGVGEVLDASLPMLPLVGFVVPGRDPVLAQ
jgi:hypothetical protein